VQITAASFAYPRVGEADRAHVARSLVGCAVPPGVFLLSTCLRVEVAVPGDEIALKERLDGLLGPVPVDPHVRQGEDAVEHLFRVAAGLDSPIVGEVEVLAQFRQALSRLREAGPTERWFVRLLESAVAAGREARQAMPSSPHDTMAAVAAQVVGSAGQVAVIGAGTMARAVVEALVGLPAPPRVTVLARQPERVRVAGVETRHIDAVPSVLVGFPVVVSATAASKGLVGRARMHEILADRAEPLLLVDMAMPPDFEAPTDGPLQYVGIDDLARLAQRRARTHEAEDIISAAAAEAHHLLATEGLAGPVIASMLATADRVVEQTVQRFAGRLTDESDREVLRQTAHTVARTILNRPVSALRATGDPDLVEVMSTVFERD
jgi:glutamyl-tRNA reductase